MSARQAGTCGEPGPRNAHCTQHRMHDYSCYDAGEDTSWNEGQWYQFDLAPHACDDSDCTDQGYRGPVGRESEYVEQGRPVSADDNAPEQAREVEVEVVDVVPLAAIAEAAARVWDGYTWRPEPTVLARADVDVATFTWPILADLYERLDPPTVVRLVDEVIELRAAVARHEAERQEAARVAHETAWDEFVQHIATHHAYNGAGDPGQRFYDERLNAWLSSLPNPYRADGVTGRSGT